MQTRYIALQLGQKHAMFRKPISYSFQLSCIKSIVLQIIWVNKNDMSEVKPQSHFYVTLQNLERDQKLSIDTVTLIEDNTNNRTRTCV